MSTTTNRVPWGSGAAYHGRLPVEWVSANEQLIYDEAYYAQDRSAVVAAAPYVRRFLHRELDTWRSCCDLGCGLGLWMRPLVDDGLDVIGVDFSDGARDSNVLGDRYVHGDLTQPLRLGREFDLVTSWEVFEHLPRSVHAAYLQNVVELRPRWFIASCAGFRVTGRDVGELDPPLEKQKGRHHYSCMTLREFADTVTPWGFEVDGVRSCIWRQIPRLPSYYRQNTLVFSRTDRARA